ncbi:MAG: PAS domain S-box protein [Spirochaetes bacterium]|jgi:PAS domain S-box-containing protein|nr:PAS domain S-box protein [Spirochaetota bacterium]
MTSIGTMKVILLVEDEVIIAEDEARTIKRFGYDVVTANNGETAIRLTISNPGIDLVLMDIDLGRGISGPEAAQRILAVRNIPIVFLSSHTEREMVEKVRGITRYGYVIKNSGNFVLQSSIEMAFELFDAHQKANFESSRNAAIIRALPDLLFVMDRTGRYKEVYTPDESLLIIPSGEVIGKKLHDIFGHEEAERHLKAYDRCFRSGDSQSLEYEMEVFGEKKQYEARLTICDENSILAIVRDVTERRRVEMALARSEEQFRLITENILDCVTLVDMNGTYLYVTPSYRETLGYAPEDMLGTTGFTITHPDDLERIFNIYMEGIEQGRTETRYETRLRHKDGHYVPMEIRARSLRDPRGKLTGAILTARDITERKQAEDKLRKSEQRMLTIIEGTHALLVSVDADGRFTYANDATAVAVGRESPEALIGKSYLEFIHPEDRQRVRDTFLDQVSALHPSSTQELRVIDSKGEVKWFSFLSTLLIEDGKFAGQSGVAQNITERRRAEESVKDLLAEKELLLREVHHRIKNNMSTIKSLLMLQSRSLKNPDASAALSDAANRIQSMSMLYDKLYRTSDLTDMSISKYLPPLVDEIISLFSGGAPVRIEKHIDDFTLSVKVLVPVGVIVNELITNAMKYAFPDRTDGMILFSAKMNDGLAVISVADNGVGLPSDIELGKSDGFGLKLVKLLAKQIKGEIMIKRGTGTKLELIFPV